jgi:hypothetical protein
VNTLNNVPSQDGDDDELVNLKDVDDDAEWAFHFILK